MADELAKFFSDWQPTAILTDEDGNRWMVDAERAGEVACGWAMRCGMAEAERDQLRARLREVERERDGWRDATRIAEGQRDAAERGLADAHGMLKRAVRIEKAAEGFIEEVERSAANAEARGAGGQQVRATGDFVNANPGLMRRLQWWARTLRAAMGKEGGHGC